MNKKDLTVTVFELRTDDGKAVDAIRGHIFLRGNKLTCDPADDLTLKDMLRREIILGDRVIDPRRDPEEFVRNLYREYRGVYLRTSKAEPLRESAEVPPTPRIQDVLGGTASVKDFVRHSLNGGAGD